MNWDRKNNVQLGYFAGLLDRQGYIALTGAGGRIRAEISIPTKSERMAKLLGGFLQRIDIEYMLKKKAYKGSPRYIVKISNLVALQKICPMLLPWVVERERIKIILQFVKSRLSTTHGKGAPYSQKERDLKDELDKLNKIHKQLR